MSDYIRNGSPAKGAMNTEPNLGPDANPVPRERSTETPASATRTWAWGRPQKPYDWMDAHTPCGDLSAWR
jgi:hypothetical protein